MLCEKNSVRPGSRRLLFLAVSVVAGFTGCANPGQPHPPSLRLPSKAQKPGAQRIGDQVILTWTTSEKTTDKDPVRGSIIAVICRETTAAKPHEPTAVMPCTAVAHATVAPGTSRLSETLPPSLSSGPPRPLTYRIELENNRGRSAGRSEAVLAAGGAAPPPVGPLTLSGRREGVLIAWAKTSDSAPLRLVRTQITPAPQPRQSLPTDQKAQPLNLAGPPTQATVVELTTPDHAKADAGGVIDHAAQNQFTYSYTAERVATVDFGGHTLELHGAMSPAATFTYRNIFPPGAPEGLVSIAGGGFDQPQSIDLSWDANLETDLLGYNIYRKDAGAGDFTRLNPRPVPAAAFRDLAAESGHTYLYRVTAVDRQLNESAPGDAVRETLRK